MATRRCACCGQEKTIRGVWYLTPVRRDSATPFVCETCYAGMPGEVGADLLSGGLLG